MPELSFDVIAVVGLLTALVALVLTHAANARLREALERQGETLDTLQQDVAAMCAAATRVGEHVATLEQRLQAQTRRIDDLELHEPGSDTYRHAARLMGKGVELEEVMEDCGLARGEAELLVLAQKLDQKLEKAS